MKFNRASKPWLCCDPVPKDDKRSSRWMHHEALLDPESPIGPALVTTNGRTLAVVPVEIEDGDTKGLITQEALIEASRKRYAKAFGFAALSANGKLVLAGDGQTFERTASDETHEFAPYKQIVPALQGDEHVFALDIKLLWALAQALGPGHDGNYLFQVHVPPGKTSPITIQSHSDRRCGFGVIMPCAIE